ncbi:hypothetical protein F5B20DRAFT_306726 [Whalleya microplaca]|nr:hypothetical protein F5B20DRAFT_306726 [Whalleya microplaca]
MALSAGTLAGIIVGSVVAVVVATFLACAHCHDQRQGFKEGERQARAQYRKGRDDPGYDAPYQTPQYPPSVFDHNGRGAPTNPHEQYPVHESGAVPKNTVGIV